MKKTILLIFILFAPLFSTSLIEVEAATATHLVLNVAPSSTVYQGDALVLWGCLYTAPPGNNVVLGKTLNFYVNGSLVGSGSDNTTGWVHVPYTVSLGPGSYEVRVVFDGDSQYSSSYTTTTLTVQAPVATHLLLSVSPSATVYQGDAVTLVSILLNVSGETAVLGKTLNFYVNGSLVGSGSDNTTGWVHVPYTVNLGPGSYGVSVVFNGDPQYASSYTNTTLTVEAPTYTYIVLNVAPSVTVYQGDAVRLAAILFNSSEPVLNKTLNFYVNGAFVGSGSDNKTGWVLLLYTVDLRFGQYEVNVTFDGDSRYLSSHTSATLIVLQRAPCLVVRGSDNRIYYRVWNVTAWEDWKSLPGSTMDSPAAAMLGNEMHIVVRGLDGNTLWYGSVNMSTNGFSGWSPLDGATNSAPVLASNGIVLCLAVRGLDNRVYYRCYAGSWGPWNAASTGVTCDGPAAAMIGNDLHIVVRGMDGNSLWDNIVRCDGTVVRDWRSVSGATPSKPVLTRSSANSLQLVVRGLDNATYYRNYTASLDSWGGWSPLPCATTDGPAATAIGNELCMVIRGSDGNTLWCGGIDLNTSSFFPGWAWLSGATPSAPTLTD